MLFRRSGHTDYRRRRVLNDSLAASALGEVDRALPWVGDSLPSSREAPRSKNYGDGAFLEDQPRPTDLVPTRRIAYLILLLLGAGAIAGLEALHSYAARLSHLGDGTHPAAFDLCVRGSLATWFSTMLLALAAATALVVYSVRRFKVDDYHGHYRVWLWAASCWLLLSIDTNAGLHQVLAAFLVTVTGTRLWADGSIWWVIAYGFLLGGVGTRLLVDMRSCRLSAGTLLLGFASYAAAVAGQFGCLELPADVDPAMAIRGAVLAGNLLVLLAMGLHGRHVILDAKGLLPWKAEAREDADSDAGSPIRSARLLSGASLTVHPPHGLPTPTSAVLDTGRPSQTTPVFTPVTPSYSATPSSVTSGWPNGPVSRKLTKQEKKALRERLERARRDRQARAG
jgi:hypothetical protein